MYLCLKIFPSINLYKIVVVLTIVARNRQYYLCPCFHAHMLRVISTINAKATVFYIKNHPISMHFTSVYYFFSPNIGSHVLNFKVSFSPQLRNIYVGFFLCNIGKFSLELYMDTSFFTRVMLDKCITIYLQSFETS